ncbi:hypothetical protein B0H67DRAFT_582495 [Lasiosphaeris hirsuta]|uniref:Uncharacterized protein n=1 Tax=Lasiosphaeris hirsuta TaxID=260670 RepID=A0AA40AHV9_9PEZI|nr:hypothetical protein B0H67DRAFT_582495 [Lasiosphaeris hirsuta]
MNIFFGPYLWQAEADESWLYWEIWYEPFGIALHILGLVVLSLSFFPVLSISLYIPFVLLGCLWTMVYGTWKAADMRESGWGVELGPRKPWQ